MPKDALKATSKAHTIYKTTDGKRVPGATTITGLLNKPHLMKWNNVMGLEGIDTSKYVDAAARVGTLAHLMIQNFLQNESTDTSDYSANEVLLAENALISFFNWEKQHNISVIACEKPFVSDKHVYGGTIDCYCLLDGVPTLLDFKTSKATYADHLVQLAAYRKLLDEHGYEVKQCRILRVGRDESEGFEERVLTDTSKYFEIFLRLLDVYYLKREVGWK